MSPTTEAVLVFLLTWSWPLLFGALLVGYLAKWALDARDDRTFEARTRARFATYTHADWRREFRR